MCGKAIDRGKGVMGYNVLIINAFDSHPPVKGKITGRGHSPE